MGVHGLSPLLKEVARGVVHLSDCDDGVVLVDGHFLMHTTVHTDDAAKTFVLDNGEVPLFEHCAAELRSLVHAGWTIVVVFDGATPPGKQRTPQEISEHRETAKRSYKQARLRHEPRAYVRHWATRAVSFSSSVTARIAKRLRRVIQRVDCYISPFEADPQMKLMQAFAQMGKARYVYATDSHLIVLGVGLLLYDDAPCLLSALLGVLTSELRAFNIQTIRGFPCTNVAF